MEPSDHLLSSFIATSATGPTQIVLSYLTEQEQARFFNLAHKFKTYQKNTYDMHVDEFVNFLLLELKQPQGDSWWNYRKSPISLNHAKYFLKLLSFLTIISLPLIVKITKRLAIAQANLKQTLYSSNPEVYCDTLLDPHNPNYCLTNVAWGTCERDCDYLARSNPRWNRLTSLFIGTSLFMALTIAGFDTIPKLIKAITEGNSRLPLTAFPLDLQQQAQQLFTEISARTNLSDVTLNSTIPASEVLTALKSINQQCQTSGQTFRFLKKQVSISLN